MRRRAIITACLLIAVCARATTVLNSKHDLSVGSRTTGPKATDQTETCSFCHASHRVRSAFPLWNRPDSTVTFTFYSSNYLNNYLGQTPPTIDDLKGSRTKLCLSCHDGVTALGGLSNVAPQAVPMSGTMSPSAIIGTDLRNQHPILYDVKPGAGPPTQPGTDPEIRLPPANDPVRVFGPTHRVECSSCHDAHNNQYGDFLVKPNGNAALCTTCHQKTNYTLSAHAASNASVSAPDGTVTTVRERSCRNCHKVHGAAAGPYLLAAPEEQTCLQCHGSPPLPGAPDVRAQFAKAYVHPTQTVSGAHQDPELDGSNLGLSARHAECQDCHNPHQAQKGTHAPPTNQLPNVLLGAWGVEPNWSGGAFTTAITYARQVFASAAGFKEYQLCLKCHSSYAFGQTPPLGGTDLSIELNPANRSAHPARVSLNALSGSVAPKALTAGQLSAPFNANAGNQTMACSDCHASDVSTDPRGPHGSAAPRLLSGPRKFWPQNAAGGLWTLKDMKDNLNRWSSDLFCVNCHPLYVNGNWRNNAHERHSGLVFSDGKPMRCIFCHVAVPHGSKRGRLIGYASDLSPYNFNGSGTLDRLQLSGFKKAAAPNSYAPLNCFSTATSCHEHGTNAGGYDP